MGHLFKIGFSLNTPSLQVLDLSLVPGPQAGKQGPNALHLESFGGTGQNISVLPSSPVQARVSSLSHLHVCSSLLCPSQILVLFCIPGSPNGSYVLQDLLQ